MKTLVTFLFILLFCFEACAQGDHNPSLRYDDKEIQKDIKTYNEEVEKCYQNFRKEAQAAETTSRMLGSVYNAVSCYMDIAHEIIDKYYSENAAEHKEVLLKYIKQSNDTYDTIYMIADVCGANGCGSMYSVLSRDAVATRVKITVEEYIQFLQQALDNKQ